NGQFLGVRDEKEITNKKPIEYYNHYLMDFIRDEHMIPVENKFEMDDRITNDYHLMKEIYEDTLGEVPLSYMIMHANSMYGSMNPLVTRVNDREIRNLFKIHFNLQGTAFNSGGDEIYNLSRL